MSYSDFDIPGIYTRTIDATQFQEESVPLVLGMVGRATKGAFNTPTKVVSISDFFNKFGPPNTSLQAYYAADAFFARGDEMWFVRVGSTPAKATMTVSVGGGGTSPILTALTEGTWAHDIDIYITDGSGGAALRKVDIYYLSALVESYDNLTNASTVGDWVTTINGVSQFITVTPGLAGGTVTSPQNGTLAGGTNGAGGASSVYEGTVSTAGVRTGLCIFRNQREYPVDLICAPDAYTYTATGQALLTLAETRGDCFALIDTADGLTAAGALASLVGLTLNTTFGAAYYPWVKYWDDKNQAYVWNPPSGHVAGAYAYNDNQAWPWFAPAGTKRGTLIKALDVRTVLSDADRRTLQSSLVNAARINPITKGQGIIIDGHRTMYAASTALRYVEVRRALIALRYLAEQVVRKVQFDPNDDTTFRSLEGQMQPVVDFMLKERAFRELKFMCDSRTNLAATKRQHQIKAQFYCKPTIAADTIILNMVLTSEGLAFSEQLLAA